MMRGSLRLILVLHIIEDYIFEDRVSASRRSGYACPEPVEAARRGGQSPPYGKSLNSHELCKAQ